MFDPTQFLIIPPAIGAASAAIVNVAKRFKIVADGDAPLYVFVVSVALFIVYKAAAMYLGSPEAVLNDALSYIVAGAAFVLQVAEMLVTARLVHQHGLSGIPVIGYVHPE